MRIHLRVKELRKEAGLNQTELGTLTGTDQSTISRLEQGKGVALDDIFVSKLCAALNTTYEYLFEGKEPKHLLAEEELEKAKNNAEALKASMTKEQAIAHMLKFKQRTEDFERALRELLEKQK